MSLFPRLVFIYLSCTIALLTGVPRPPCRTAHCQPVQPPAALEEPTVPAGVALTLRVSVKQLLKATLLVCQEYSQFRLPLQL